MKTYEFEENLKQLNLEVRIFRDGDQWCACYSNFVDIQESVCAFGDNCIQALEALIKEERNK